MEPRSTGSTCIRRPREDDFATIGFWAYLGSSMKAETERSEVVSHFDESSSEACVGCDLEADLPPSCPVALVIFGATGDLAARKIFPALYNLALAGRFHPDSRIVAVGRKAFDTPAYVATIAPAISEHSRRTVDAEIWTRFAGQIGYLQGELSDRALYESLAGVLRSAVMPRMRLYYLAIGPDQFAIAAEGLAAAGLGSAVFDGARAGEEGVVSRLVVEKPFGSDLASARDLTRRLQGAFLERDIFRIDHYLGKETVQNLLYLRFANSVFEPLWNRDHIARIEIDALETVGIGTRGGYYDRAGAARDMLQNHLFQLLCLTAMEPPASLDPEAIRDEKVKVLRSIPRYEAAEWRSRSLRARYSEGRSPAGAEVPAYLREAKVAPDSTTETFVALRLEVDNWRFAGVPFVLRTGKALDRRSSEIRVVFRSPPRALFSSYGGELGHNILTIKIQPDEGLWFSFNMKVPGRPRVEPRDLRFGWSEGDGLPEAYERLLDDAIRGDSTLFIRADESEAAWDLVDGLRRSWGEPVSQGAPASRGSSASRGANDSATLLEYPAGSPPLRLPGVFP